MHERILFVDDDINILEGYKRQLRKKFEIDTAEGSEMGLKAIKNNNPYAVIVSDLRMPGMDGNQFLSRVKEIAPETIRIMLTGYADLKSAMEAINNGNIYRLLTKPCDKDILIDALNSGIEHYNKNMNNFCTDDRDPLSKPRKNILLLDDDPVTGKLLTNVLERNNDFQVFTAHDGKEAINIMNHEFIDLMITDLQMPMLNGLELLTYINKKYPIIRVIVLTGRGSEKLEEKVKAMGDYQYYEKPLDMNVFFDTVMREMRSIPSGQIHGIHISSFLQLIDIEGKNCTLTIRSNGKIGYLYFRDGELIDAQTGRLRKEKAARHIINWENSVIEVDDVCRKNKREIDKPLMHILMESARIKDENNMIEESYV